MFRQILVHPENQKFQQILWRYNLDEVIKAYSIQTVTYGMVSSTFLAIRILKELAIDEGSKYSLAVQVLNEETYMHDTTSGGPSLSEALNKQKDLIGICKMGGMNLHKWVANDVGLLNFPRSIIAESVDSCFGLLGLNGYPDDDYFSFTIIIDKLDGKITKKKVLSSIAKLYDALGLLAPVVITAKAFI